MSNKDELFELSKKKENVISNSDLNDVLFNSLPVRFFGLWIRSLAHCDFLSYNKYLNSQFQVEIVQHIFMYLPDYSLLQTSLASKQWNELSNDSKIWKSLYIRRTTQEALASFSVEESLAAKKVC